MAVPAVSVGNSQYALRTGYLLLAFTAITWGLNFPVLKLGLDYSPPLLYTALRMFLGMLTMFAVAYAMGILRLPAKADFPVVLSVGLLQNMGFIGLVTAGLQFLPAGRSAILAYTSPIWVVPAAALFLGERLTPGRLVGVALGLLGLMAMFNPLALSWQEPGTLIGAGLILSATFVWTLGLVHIRLHHWHGDVLSLMPWQLLTSVVVMVPLALALESPAAIDWQPAFYWNVLFSGAIASGVCVAAQVGAMRSLPAVSMSLSSMAVPAVGVLTSIWVLSERPTIADITGFALIAAGILAVALSDRRAAVAAAEPSAIPPPSR
ncbi:MAG: DMT family transporter [Ectothiorhodospiraceae bacterium]|nr:DMT family transporter [Ectothiorhodospiraceae bacterium]